MMRSLPALACLLFTLVPAGADGLLPGRDVSMPKAMVFDTFLAYFAGVVDSDSLGYADTAYLHVLMPEFDSFLSLSFEQISRVSRVRAAGGTEVSVTFSGPMALPIPFKVLWDTPGTIRATSTVVARETRYPSMEQGLGPVYVYDVVAGKLEIDFDPWLDGLLWNAVDDVSIHRALLFRLEDRWYAALMGPGYEGQLVIGYFDLAANRILVPVPRKLRFIAPLMGSGDSE